MSVERKKRCPYCGKRLPYFSAYMSRRKAEYVCPRCGKESRVVISKGVIVNFLICAVISVLIIAAWIVTKTTSNPIGIVLATVPLLIFLIVSPKYVRLEALKKYQKSMEARKAGLEYSDSFALDSIDEDKNSLDSTQFSINADVFNKIKAERSSSKNQKESDEIVSHSDRIGAVEAVEAEAQEEMIPVIQPVSAGHYSTDEPLKKLHTEGSHTRRSHYIPITYDGDGQTQESPQADRYSGNRKF